MKIFTQLLTTDYWLATGNILINGRFAMSCNPPWWRVPLHTGQELVTVDWRQVEVFHCRHKATDWTLCISPEPSHWLFLQTKKLSKSFQQVTVNRVSEYQQMKKINYSWWTISVLLISVCGWEQVWLPGTLQVWYLVMEAVLTSTHSGLSIGVGTRQTQF